MLGGSHFKKKAEKKDRKKEAKRVARVSGGAASSSSTPAVKKSSLSPQQKSRNYSTLKGPVVAYNGRASRDSANDRKYVPFTNKTEEHTYKKEHRIPLYPSPATSEKRVAVKQSGASSAAQRRRVLRSKGDDDLLDHFRQKLNASTFRLLNEQIYNAANAFAGQLLRDRQTFEDYHTGYRQQLVQWPVNPSQLMIDALLGDRRGKFPANRQKSMPGHIPPSWVVADMGCGEAQIAAALRPRGYTVHSFDFCALNDYVTVANMAHVPMEKDSVDVCIFSLSLMATDYQEALFEAFRIVKPRRLLKIVEVRSRIPHPRQFAELVEGIGFDVDYYDVAGDYFVAFDFIKRDGQEEANRSLVHYPNDVLLPSLYKKR